MLQRIQQALLIDRPLIYALAARFWQAISGPITIALILSVLSAPETGIYYSLGAIAGMQVFFELGLLNVLISQAGHAVSSSSPATPGYQNERMVALILYSERWFVGIGFVYAVSACLLGYFSFIGRNTDLDWKAVLFLLIFLSAWTFALSPSQALLEGAGKRSIIYRYRLFQAITGSITVWTTLILGGKLWALVTSAFVQLAWALHLRYVEEASFFKRNTTSSSLDNFSWTRDILPTQWRAAVMSLAYFAATQFLILIALYFDSEAAAGRLGITLNIVIAIQMFALAWVQTNFSTISIQHGSGNREAAGNQWRKLAFVSTSILILALAALIAVIAILPWLDGNLKDRFLTPFELSLYALGCVGNHLLAVQSFYVLAQKSAPLWRASVTGFTVTTIAIWIGGATLGLMGLLASYSITIVFVGLPLHTWAYLQFRKST